MSAPKKLVILPAVAVLLGVVLSACRAASTAEPSLRPAFQTPVVTGPPTAQPVPVPEPPEVQTQVAVRASVVTVPPTPQPAPVPEPPEVQTRVAVQTPAPVPASRTGAREDEIVMIMQSSAKAALAQLQAGELDLRAERGLDSRLLNTVRSDSDLCIDGPRTRP